MSSAICPVWKTRAFIDIQGSEVTIDSPRAAGGYRLDTIVYDRLKHTDLSDLQKARLTTRIINLRREGSLYESAIPAPLLSEDDLHLESLQPLPVTRRADRLLKCFAQTTRLIGDAIEIGAPVRWPEDLRNRMLAFSESTTEGEVEFLIDDLLSKGWLRAQDGAVIVTVDGYAHLDEPGDRALATLAARVAAFMTM